MTNPATGRPLRQLLGDELAPYLAGKLRIYLIERELWNPELDMLDQQIPTAETPALLALAAAVADDPDDTPNSNDRNGRRHAPSRRTR